MEEAPLNRELLVGWLHLGVLWSFAFAKPLFDVLADEPAFFVARASTSADILLFALSFALVPPALLVLVELACAAWPRVRRVVHLLFVAGLFAVFAVQVLDDLFGASSELLVVAAGLLAVAGAAAYARTRLIPSMLTVLSPAPLVFLFLFLVTSPVSKLVLPQNEASADSSASASRTPVVMVVFDEFDPNMLMNERQRIDRTRYPNLAALADDSTWYRNATTVNSQTVRAVPALLSGRRPTREMLPIRADYPDTLFSLLSRTHAMHVTETATELCPTELCGERARDPFGERMRSLAKDLGIVSLHLVAPAGLESRLPAVDRTFGNFGNGGRDQTQPGDESGIRDGALINRPAQFAALMHDIRPERGRPGLYFLHAALPHIPWQYLPGGQQYVSAGPDFPGLDEETWSSDPVPVRLGLQRALLQTGYVDHLVGRLVARLRETGIYDRALIVITADHGVSFRPGQGRRTPRGSNGSDIAGVPLLIKYPHRAGGKIDTSAARTIDVVPTIAHALGMKLPWPAEGRPLDVPDRPASEVIVNWPKSGNGIELGFDDYVHEREAGLSRMLAEFGFGDHGRRLYANGANWDLLNRPVGSLETTAPTAAKLELDSTDVLDRYRPGQHVTPSFVSGSLSGGVAAHTSLALAIGGRIRSVTETFANGAEVRMAALVPASAFGAGDNSVDVYAVKGKGRARALAAVEVERPESYRLVDDTVVGAGEELAVEDGRMDGFVDRFEPDDQGTRISGWAVEHGEAKPAERILVFYRGRLVAEGAPTKHRPDIAGRLGAAADLSGFQLRAPVAGIHPDDVDVVAVSGERAGPVPFFEE